MKNLPSLFHGIKHLEQCAMSNALAGYGILSVAITPIIAGTPLSNANCTCASCESLGANDMVMMPLFRRKAPQLAT